MTDKIWKKFKLCDEFSFVNFKPLHAVNIQTNEVFGIPYVTRTKINNGIDGYINPESIEKKYLNPGKAISFGAETGKMFYQPVKFVAGNKMYGIYNDNLTELTAPFVIAILTNGLKDSGFEYGYGMIPERIKHRKLPFPVDSFGKIDWKYMAQFINNLSCNLPLFPVTKNHIKNSLELSDRSWHLFTVCKIVDVHSGRDYPKIQRSKGVTPYVGSSSKTNGVTDNIKTNELTPNNFAKGVVSVARNGSVGYSFYHPYLAYFSGDVRYIESSHLNIYTGLFLTQAIMSQKSQFAYGFKLGTERLKNLKISLPIDDDCNPDWNFMEKYIRSLPNSDLL